MSAADHPYFAPPPIGLAHRGGSRYPPNVGVENTLRAFAAAVRMGYRYLETDVHATRDGHLVAFHDEDLTRVTDRSGRISQLPWREVRRARIGGTEPIPTLDEVFEAFPDTRINIDIKSPGAIEPLWQAIRGHAAYQRVCVGSFSQRSLGAFRRLAGPGVATAAGQLGTAALRWLPRQVSRWLATPAQVLQIPVSHVVAGRTVRLVTPALLGTARALGKQVHVWTVDDAAQMQELFDAGVDGIVTDRIDVLRDVLLARGAWPQ